MKFLRTDIINYLIKKYAYKSYLEIGTRNVQSNFNKINAPIKECIDPKPMKGNMTYKMTSDKAFELIKAQKKTFDIIFVDGLHTKEQVDKDIKNSLQVLNQGGAIVLHDCNPISANHATPTPLKLGVPWNGTVWQAIVNVRTTRDDLNVCVVDTDWGCGIIKKGTQQLYIPKEGDPIYDYSYLEQNRRPLLNLISVKQFKQLY